MQRFTFDRGTTARDLQEQLAIAVGLNRLCNIVLKTKRDVVVAISPTMVNNTSRWDKSLHFKEGDMLFSKTASFPNLS